MAKKNDSSTKPAASAAAAPNASAAPAPVKRTVKAAAAKPKPAAKKAKPVSAAKASALKAKRPSQTAVPAGPAYTRDDVALRAYFISEKRRAGNLPGDEHQDWLEAERQLLTESLKPKKAKKA